MSEFERWKAKKEEAERAFIESSTQSGVLDYAPLESFKQDLLNYTAPPSDNMATVDGLRQLEERKAVVKQIGDSLKNDWQNWDSTIGDFTDSTYGNAEKDFNSVFEKVNSPVYGNSWFQNFVTGFDASPHRLMLGAQQITGRGDQQAVQDEINMMKPLMDTVGGQMGVGLGNAVFTAPAIAGITASIPAFGATGLGAMATRALVSGAMGAGEGAIQPVADGESRGWNATFGGMIGSGLQGAVDTVAPVVRNLFGSQDSVVREGAERLLNEANPSARATVEGFGNGDILPNAKLTTPEYMTFRGNPQPAWNVRQDAWQNQTVDGINQFSDANTATANAMEGRIVGAFNGADKTSADVLRETAMETSGAMIGQARKSDVPINARGVVNFMDNFIKDNPVNALKTPVESWRNALVKQLTPDEMKKNAISLNRSFLKNNNTIRSTAERDALKSADLIIANDSIDFGGTIYKTATIEQKISVLAKLSRQLNTKTGKDHIRAVVDTLKTGEIPYNRIKDMHDLRKRISGEIATMSPEMKRDAIPLLAKIDRAIAMEMKDWGSYMSDYASMMNSAKQAEAGQVLRQGISNLGTDTKPTLNITKFKTLIQRADEKFLSRSVGGKYKVRFTPAQLQVMKEVREVAQSMDGARNLGQQSGSRSQQRIALSEEEMKPTSLLKGKQGLIEMATNVLGRFDKRVVKEMYSMMANPSYFGEVLRNMKPKDRWVAHAIRANLLGFQSPIVSDESGRNDYITFAEMSPEEQEAYLQNQPALDAGKVYGEKK